MRNALFVIAALILTGCTTYADTTKAVQLGQNVHRVSMKGNAFNKQSDAQDFALLKAAEVTIDNNHKYFTIESSTDTTRHSTYTAPSTYNSTTTTTANASVFGNQVTGNAFSNTSGTYNQGQTHNFVKPGLDVLIKTYPNKPNVDHFEAADIVKFIGPRLNPKRWGDGS